MDSFQYTRNLKIDFNAQQYFNNNTKRTQDLKINNENPEKKGQKMRMQH